MLNCLVSSSDQRIRWISDALEKVLRIKLVVSVFKAHPKALLRDSELENC